MSAQHHRLVFLRDFPAYRMKAFGGFDGQVHFITDELLAAMPATQYVDTIDDTGAIRVHDGTSVYVPVSPKQIEPQHEGDSGVRFGRLEIRLERYLGPNDVSLIAGYAKYYDRAIWAVRD